MPRLSERHNMKQPPMVRTQSQAIVHYVSAKRASLSAFLCLEIGTILSHSSACLVPVCSSVMLPFEICEI